MTYFIFNPRIILIACIVIFLSSCFGERPKKDKYPQIQELSEITNPDFKIIKSGYNEFVTTPNFHFATERNRESFDEYLVILNKEFETIKKIKLQSKYSRFAIFDDLFFLIESSNSRNSTLTDSIIRINYTEFDKESIKFISRPQIIFDSIKNSLPDSLLKTMTHSSYSIMENIDSIYCNSMNKELSKNLEEVYEINYPTNGRYFILDYGDKMLYYKENRRSYRKSCWSDIQMQEMLKFGVERMNVQTNRINPFDKAFTKWTTNRAIGGQQQSGYQYFKTKTKSKEIQFKKYLGQYFNPEPQFHEVYASTNRDSILLEEHNFGSNNTLYWIIERNE